jgi:hypothetical protein
MCQAIVNRKLDIMQSSVALAANNNDPGAKLIGSMALTNKQKIRAGLASPDPPPFRSLQRTGSFYPADQPATVLGGA